jgi:hypothetical protein
MSYGQQYSTCDECKRPFKDGEIAVATKEVKCVHFDGWTELVDNQSVKFIEVYCDECWDAILFPKPKGALT